MYCLKDTASNSKKMLSTTHWDFNNCSFLWCWPNVSNWHAMWFVILFPFFIHSKNLMISNPFFLAAVGSHWEREWGVGKRSSLKLEFWVRWNMYQYHDRRRWCCHLLSCCQQHPNTLDVSRTVLGAEAGRMIWARGEVGRAGVAWSGLFPQFVHWQTSE